MAGQIKIGGVSLGTRVVLAPMAGVSDLPFRLLCAEMGASMVWSEMVSAKAITYHNKNTFRLLETCDQEAPLALQLFGSDPQVMGEAAHMIADRPFAFIDLNMGCPVPKVAGNGEGSSLMKDPELAGRIIESVVRYAGKPVTFKIRSGFDSDHINAAQVARIGEQAGASAVAVHARTREQFYSGKADWSVIREVKEAVSIPVIGNGDVTNGMSAKAMLEETGCDAVMVGRAARGNPWIFRRISHFLEMGEELPGPSVTEVKEMILRHARMEVSLEGEKTAMREMRKHVAWYTGGMPYSSRLREESNHIETMKQLEELLTKRFV